MTTQHDDPFAYLDNDPRNLLEELKLRRVEVETSITARVNTVRRAYAAGMSYRAIGDAVGLNHETVRQLCVRSDR